MEAKTVTPCNILSAAGVRKARLEFIRTWPGALEHATLAMFVTDWCEVSLAASERLARIARSLEGRFELLCVNVDEAAHEVERLGVRSVPTLVIYAQGQETARLVGLVSEAELSKFVSAALTEPVAGPAVQELERTTTPTQTGELA